ncbi:MAG: type II secretion system secretin GspD [Rhodocyclaceae bacterium]
MKPTPSTSAECVAECATDYAAECAVVRLRPERVRQAPAHTLRPNGLRLSGLTLALSLALAGCAGQPARQDRIDQYLSAGAQSGIQPGETVAAGEPLGAASPAGGPESASAERRAEALIYRGSNQMIAPPRQPRAVEQRGDSVSLEFSQAPLGEVVQALLGDLLKLDFTIDRMPEGTVSLRTGAPIPRDSVLPIVESMLQSNGAALVRDPQGVYRVTTQEGVRQQGLGLHRPDALPQGYGLVVVPLRYVGAREMADILEPVAPPEALVRVDAMRNLLVLAGSRGQHEGWMEIIRSFDVDFLKGMSLGIFPLEFAAVDDVYETVGAMLGRTPTGDGAETTGGDGGVLGSAVRMFPIKRLNSLVVVSPRSEHLDTVREWVLRLDQPALNDLEPRLYVYPVQNGSASHLAELLSALYGGSSGTSSAASSSADSGVAPGLSQTSLTGTSSSSSSSSSDMATLPDTNSSGGLTTQVGLGDQVKVVADERNNALIILAPRKDYRKIEAALRQLDVAPTQVLIEASIIEVRLTGDLQYGLEWTFSGRLGGGRSGSGLLNLNSEGGIGPAQPGFSYAITGAGGNISAVLNALAQRSLLRVLSSPSLLVQDNHTASIHVGDQQPIQTATTIVSNTSPVQTTIEYRDTGVMLSVTPSVNAGGLVSMDIHQTVTDVGAIDEATKQRSFLQRQIKSKVSVRSGETVVMGGLIRDRSSDGRAGLPVLHELPLVGNLFGSTTTQTNSTELLVLITPRVIASDAQLRAVGDEMRERMRGVRLQPLGLVRPQGE